MKAPVTQRGPVPISGYLHKMKATERVLTPQWNRRYFALEGRELKYYPNETSSEPSKVIDLLSIESIRRFENGDHGVYRYAKSFDVIVGGSMLYSAWIFVSCV
ncbi:hypothetical protein PINS_up009981 [Pythium insidiosum]|nr:hypothetical protein PINS_up009981 [Pythium insidiosum]